MQTGGTFKEVKASKLFYVKSNPQLDKENFVFSKDSKYPYFTRTMFNNGLLGYVDYFDKEHLIPGNSIAVGMMGMRFFYQAHDFYAGQFTKTIFPLFKEFNEKIALWFIAWFNKFSTKLLSVLVRDFELLFNNITLYVPYKNGLIDFGFIEKYVSSIEKERTIELKSYLHAVGFEDCTLTSEEEEALIRMQDNYLNMKEVKITDCFKVSNSHNILKSDVVFGSGTTPYVTASANNNSITSYISYDETMKEPGNTIMIGGKTLVVTYQPNDFFSNDSHNLVLRLFNENGRNEDSQLFLVSSLIKSLSPKYSWGDSISKQKIQTDSILLPFKDGEIDFTFMATYIRAIKKQCIARLKTEIDARS